MLKKNLTPLYVTKISITRGLGKKLLHKQTYPYPLSKVKWSAPRLNSKNEFIINKQ